MGWLCKWSIIEGEFIIEGERGLSNRFFMELKSLNKFSKRFLKYPFPSLSVPKRKGKKKIYFDTRSSIMSLILEINVESGYF